MDTLGKECVQFSNALTLARIVFPGETNAVSKRIHGVEPVTGQTTGAGGAVPKTLQLQPGIEFYFEEGELAS